MTNDIIANQSNKWGQAGLVCAAQSPYREELIPLMIKKGVDMRRVLLNILSESVATIDILNIIMNSDNNTIFAKDEENGMTALMYAVNQQPQEIVEFLATRLGFMRENVINKGDYDQLKRIDDFIHCARKKDSYTAYLIACEMGFIQIVKLLIDNLELDVNKCYAKDFSCIGYKFTGSEVAKAKGENRHLKLARWLKPQEIQGWFYSNQQKYYRYKNYGYENRM